MISVERWTNMNSFLQMSSVNILVELSLGIVGAPGVPFFTRNLTSFQIKILRLQIGASDTDYSDGFVTSTGPKFHSMTSA